MDSGNEHLNNQYLCVNCQQSNPVQHSEDTSSEDNANWQAPPTYVVSGHVPPSAPMDVTTPPSYDVAASAPPSYADAVTGKLHRVWRQGLGVTTGSRSNVLAETDDLENPQAVGIGTDGELNADVTPEEEKCGCQEVIITIICLPLLPVFLILWIAFAIVFCFIPLHQCLCCQAADSVIDSSGTLAALITGLVGLPLLIAGVILLCLYFMIFGDPNENEETA